MDKSMPAQTELREIQSECLVQRHHHHKKRDAHQHNGIEMAYVLNGQATHVIKEKYGSERKLTFSQGQFVILDYHTSHAYLNCSNDFLLINILFRPELIHGKLAGISSFEELIAHPLIGFDYSMLRERPVNRHFTDENKQIHLAFEKARKDFNNNVAGSGQLLRCHIIEIIVTTLQKLLINTPTTNSSTTISAICDYVDRHYKENITLTRICQDNYFSLPYISKKFKKVRGISFEQYLQQVRVYQACTLLLETGMSVDAIANHVNYSDTAAFRKTFKKLMGKSPSAFRKTFTKPTL